MEYWLLPGSILIVKFLLKLFIDRQVDLPEFINSVLALPFDIAFLASSLLASLVILEIGDTVFNLGMFIISLVVGILAAFLWRRSTSFFAKEKYVFTALTSLLNITLSAGVAIYAVRLLSKGNLS